MGKIFILNESPLKRRYLSRDLKKQRMSEPCRHLEVRCPAKERVSTRFVWEHVLHLERLSHKTSKMSLLFSSLVNEELTPGIAFFHLKDIIPLCVCVCVLGRRVNS